MPKFFVPKCDTPEDAERVYAELAAFASAAVAVPGKRIARIAFRHNGDAWSAAVGEQLRGRRTERKRRQGKMIEVSSELSDSATVLAIYDGVPTMVVTDARPLTSRLSYWENPFMAGVPTFVEYFDEV